jgi:nucleotide-binding universal stress UspA family protein
MQRFKNLLVLCEDSLDQDSVLERAVWIARRNAARLTLLDLRPEARAAAAPVAALAEALRAGGLRVTQARAPGAAPEAISARVRAGAHDLVLKGALCARRSAFLPGPDIRLLRQCPCPVWVLNRAAGARTRAVMAAVDPDPEDPRRDRLNHSILRLAASLAAQDGARLDVLSVWRLPEEGALRSIFARVPAPEVEAMVERARRDSAWRLAALTRAQAAPAAGRVVLHRKGLAAEVIPAQVAARGIDTLVMGSMARSGVAGLLLGNTSETVLPRVAASVVTVKPESSGAPAPMYDAATEEA